MNLIAAYNSNKALGKENTLLYHLESDLKHFKHTTKNHVIVMGRNTFESLPRVLPGRLHIVISRTFSYDDPNVRIVRNRDELDFQIKMLEDEGREVFIIGGGQLYEQYIEDCDTLYLTEIVDTLPGDTYFPHFNKQNYKEEFIDYIAATKTSPAYTIYKYTRSKYITANNFNLYH